MLVKNDMAFGGFFLINLEIHPKDTAQECTY